MPRKKVTLGEEVKDKRRVIKIDYSEMQVFRKCRRQWFFYSPQHWNRRSASSPPALWLGEGVHHALEMYYGKDVIPTKAFDKWLSENRGRLGMGSALTDMVELGQGMLHHYYLWEEDRKKTSKFNVIEQEISFEIPINELWNDERRVYYYGRMDGLVQVGKNPKDIFIHEIKTMKTLDDNVLLLAEQASMYLWAARQLFPDRNVKGVIYTLIKKQSPNPFIMDAAGALVKPKANTDSLMLREALGDYGITKRNPNYEKSQKWLKEYQENEADNPYIWRRMVLRNASEMSEVRQRMGAIMSDMVNSPMMYPTPDFFGCKFCAYQEPCLALNRGDDWEDILRNAYTVRDDKGDLPAYIVRNE